MEEDVVQAAESVWLLMGKEYRISRSIPRQWFFENLKSVVAPKSNDEIVNSTAELEVLSVIPADPSNYNGEPLRIVPTTKLPFVGRQYRFVFCIDMSPSLATVDTETGNVLIDDMFQNLKNTLTGLVQPFQIPGSSLIMKPRLHITVLAHTYMDVKKCRVLVQGYCVNEGNVKHFLCRLKHKLQHLERSIAEDIANCNQMLAVPVGDGDKPSVKRETSLFYMIRDGLVALQLLPDNASAGIIVITDGVFILENAMITDALLAQVRACSSVVSFLQVGTGYRRASVDFGYVPHCALMQFIATTTSGAYLATCPPAKGSDCSMNLYHKALYCLHFQRDIDRYKIDSSQGGDEIDSPLSNWTDYFDCLTPYKEMAVSTPPQPRQTMRYVEFSIKTRISSVLTVRLREGYIADGIQLTKNDTRIEVKLVWPWKEHITIEYIAKAAWPFDSSSYLTDIVVNVSGPYEFLVDITSPKPKNHKFFRKTVLQRFDQTMKSLDMSDQLLVQLQLFPIHPAASKIPDTIAKGSPLFYMPQNSNVPIIELQYGSKPKKSSKSPEVQFANFWKSVVTMDTTIWWDTRTWAKWWHIHRINILPEHNRPVMKDLFIPTSTNHYPPVYCRAAITAFNHLMKDWCSFILLESHSYVKFITRPGEEKPHTFCLLRLTFKGLCIGLRWAFLAGTPGKERFQVFEGLKRQLMNLTASIYKVSSNEEMMSENSSRSLAAPEPKCLILLTKQVERILVKYDSIPDEVKSSGHPATLTSTMNVSLPLSEAPMNQYATLQDPQRSPGQVLSQYLFNQRWVWLMRSGENASLDATSIAHMLDAILKQRLHEGFHFWVCNKGIISLVKEVDVVVDSSEDNMANCCVVQYVLFPPHQQSLMQSNIQDDSVESDGMPEVEEDMQMVIEVWVEPQYGTMDVVNSPLDYINGLEYHEVPAKMFEVDAQIVSEISSYMLIHTTCVRKDVSNCFPCVDTVRPTIPTDVFQSFSIVRVPFLYDIVALLRKSRLVLSVYPMMRQLPQVHLGDAPQDMNDILLTFINATLTSMNDCEILLRPTERKLIHAYMQERCISNNKQWHLEEGELQFNKDLEEEINFKCYVKSFGLRLVIMLLPASIKDLDMLIANVQMTNVSSMKRRNLLFFIFECDYESMQNIPSSYPSAEHDTLQDYTEALNESALTPRHFNQKLPDDRSKDIAVYCQTLYEHYFWALVSGVYKCLQSGYKLDPDDVELSIDLVCEESIKEIDLTNFLKTTCFHYNDMVNTNSVFSNDEALTDQLSVEFSLKPTLLHKSSSNERGRNPRRMCENDAWKVEVERHFMEILSAHFESVPGNSYCMYFKDDSNTEGRSTQRESLRSSNTTESSREFPSEFPSSSDDEMESDLNDSCQLNDGEIFDESSEKNNGQEQRPMFLHLTCSCHYRSVMGNAMTPISVKTIPTCLCDITRKLDECVSDIDPYNSSLSITLTLICLTQPVEPEQDEEWAAPKNIVLTRQNSAESSVSQESDRQKRQIMSQQSSDSFNIDANSFTCLPLEQQKAMDKVISEINWLLEDEIASALRLHMPLTEESLISVATHVKNSKMSSKTNCIYEKRYFMFVTETEKATDLCLPLFVNEVESTMLGKYILTRVGMYWCVVLTAYHQTDSESDSGATFEKVKEKAKLARKGKQGHRRSQSDYSDTRPPTQERPRSTDFAGMASRTSSLPAICFPQYLVESDSHADDTSPSSGGFHPLSFGPLWQTDASTSGGMPHTMSEPMKMNTRDSSVDTSSTSLINEEESTLRRCVSYSEEKRKYETQRRSFSVSDIYSAGSSCDGISGLNIHRPFIGHPVEKVFAVDNPSLNSGGSSSAEYSEKVSNESSELEEEQLLRPHPHFWLFMQITEESVFVFWHRRRSEQQKNIKHQESVYQRLLESLDKICKIVNQQILLDQLSRTNNCHNLLLPEDEDQVWDNQVESSSSIMVVKKQDSDTPFSSVIHGEYRFPPGFFKCEMVWEERIPIHNRLRMSMRQGECSKALLAVRNVLSKFRVANRRNLFVIKESIADGNIFYFRVNEGNTENECPRVNISPTPDDEHLFTPVREDLIQQSRASSVSSLVKDKNEEQNAENFDRFNYDRQDSYQSGQYQYLCKVSDDKCSVSETSSQIHNPQDYLHFCVYGIREPGKEIKEEIVKLMRKKLDLTTLDIINQSLARNLKCRLSPQDVEFIQPAGQAPSRVLTLCVSTFASRYLHAMIFYLHQYLLDKYSNPRYTVTDNECAFKNYCPKTKAAEFIDINDVYLYNRRQKGNYGIAIAYLRLVDEHDRKVVAQPSYPSLNTIEMSMQDHLDIFNQLVILKKKEELCGDETNMCQTLFIQFSIWLCGDIELGLFENDLIENAKYALHDVFLEYHLLCTPICFIPAELQMSTDSSRRESVQRSWGHVRPVVNSSSSSSATTPKLLKSHPTLKKFPSEPTTPSDMRRESPLPNAKCNMSKDDLILVSESPRSSYGKELVGDAQKRDMKRYSYQETLQTSHNIIQQNTFAKKDTSDDSDKKRNSSQESRQSPLQKRESREDSPLTRQVSSSSRTSVFIDDASMRSHDTPVRSPRVDSPSVDPSNQPKTITMSELNQLKDAKDATYVMLTDAEVHESLKAVTNSDGDDGGDVKAHTTWQEVEMQRRLELDKRKKRRMLQHGAVGELHPNYFECCSEMFDHMMSKGNQSIHKQEGLLTHQYMLETVVKEFRKEMEDKSPDMKPKLFKENKRLMDDGEVTVYVQYQERGSFKVEDSTSDTISNTSTAYPSLLAGAVKRYIVIAHNAHKWLLSMGVNESELSDEEEGKNAQEEQSKQKFKAYIPPNALTSQERRKLNDVQPPSCISSLFVPRQKFFIAIFNQKKITLYTYNYSNDVTAALDRQLKRLYAWNNVRTHLNACLFTQKLGLYHHKHFVRDCPGREDPDVGMFSSSSSRHNLVPLMKEVSPKAREKAKDHIRNVNIAEFDEIFVNTAPSKVLHQSSYVHIRDVVKRQAHQYQDVRNIKLQRASREGHLKEIFEAWKDTGAHVPITEDRLQLLKKHSRLLHYCAAPILFDIEEDESEESIEEKQMEVKKSREMKGSPHSLEEGDGVGSMGALDGYQELLLQYIQYLQTRGLNLVQMANKGGGSRLVLTKGKGVTVRSSRTSNRSSDGKDIIICEEHPSKYYLQQTSMAGIILMEVYCEKNYLCYNMLAFESVQLREISHQVSARDQRNFFEDCGKFKDLTYIRSFTYDYHIRQIQFHLCGRRSIFPKGYPVHMLMQNIMQHYRSPPRYCTCMLTDGEISLPNSQSMLQNTIYNYLVINAGVYNLSKIPVSTMSHEDLEYLDPNDYILTYSRSTEKNPVLTGDIWRSRREVIEYDGNVALMFKSPENNDVIKWPFFLVLVNRVEFYPRPSFVPSKRRQKLDLETSASACDAEFAIQRNRLLSKQTSSTGSLRHLQHSLRYSPKDVSISPELHTESSKNLSHSSESEYSFSMGMSISQHFPLTAQHDFLMNEQKFVNDEVSNVCNELNGQVAECLSNCLRDLMWNALLISETVLEEESLSKKVKKKGSTQNSEASSLVTSIHDWKSENRMDAIPNISISELTFSSIQHLIGLVKCYGVGDIDSRISDAYSLIQPGLQQNVIKTLNAKYGLLCRQFLSEDGETMYLCIINPCNLDMIMLVEADEKGKKMEFSAVYRTKVASNPLETTTDELLRQRERASRDHIENVITCLCYDIWLQLLPT